MQTIKRQSHQIEASETLATENGKSVRYIRNNLSSPRTRNNSCNNILDFRLRGIMTCLLTRIYEFSMSAKFGRAI